MLTVTSFGNGTCTWCRKEQEGVQAKFADGLAGFFCKRHLWEAVKARSEKAKEVHDARAT